ATLAAAADLDPRRLLDRLTGHDSVEVRFARCRAHLELGELARAEDDAVRAGELLGEAAGHDWRMHWHRGLLALARGDVATAEGCFGAVYAELPASRRPSWRSATAPRCAASPRRRRGRRTGRTRPGPNGT